MNLDKEVAEFMEGLDYRLHQTIDGTQWVHPSSPITTINKKTATFFYTATKRAELKVLNNLVDNSDCLEDGCGLDAELLRHNVLNRISELEAQLNNSNKENE